MKLNVFQAKKADGEMVPKRTCRDMARCGSKKDDGEMVPMPCLCKNSVRCVPGVFIVLFTTKVKCFRRTSS